MNERKSNHRRTRKWKSSNGPSPKAQSLGRFELVCFCLVGGFAVGLVVGLGMGGVFAPKYLENPRVGDANESLSSSFTLSEDKRNAQIAASLRRLEAQGLDVDELKYKGRDLSDLANEAFKNADAEGALFLSE